MNPKILLVVTIILVIVTLFLIYKLTKKEKPVCPSIPITPPCPSATAQQGWPDSLKKEGDNSVLDLVKLNSTIVGDTGKDYTIFPGPVFFPNGIKIYKDAILSEITPEAINSELESGDLNLSDNTLQSLLKLSPENISGLDPVTKEEIEAKIKHYIQLFDQFLVNNPDAGKEWRETLDYLKYLFTGRNPEGGTTPPPLPTKPSMSSIYNWTKYLLSSLGGVGTLLKNFQKRIKYDIIQQFINIMRTTDPNAPIFRSKSCTAYPLSWWQNCPNGSKPVGSQGWGNDKEKYACNKWYQHLSGELLCQNYTADFTMPFGKKCEKFFKDIDWVNSKTIHDMIAKSLSEALAAASLIPKIGPIIVIVEKVIKLSLPYLGDFSWILADLKDICYNFVCQGETDKKVCDGVAGCEAGDCYCIPSISDQELASRDCSKSDSGCFTAPSGVCTKKLPDHSLQALGSENNFAPGYQYWSN